MNYSDSGVLCIACKKRRDAIILSLSIALMLLLAALFFLPMARLANFLIPDCILARFGLRCALCGGTRCLGALYRLKFALALYYNPLVTVVLPVIIYMYLRLVFSCFTRAYKPYCLRISAKTLWIIAGVLLCFTVIRNFPFYRAVMF